MILDSYVEVPWFRDLPFCNSFELRMAKMGKLNKSMNTFHEKSFFLQFGGSCPTQNTFINKIIYRIK